MVGMYQRRRILRSAGLAGLTIGLLGRPVTLRAEPAWAGHLFSFGAEGPGEGEFGHVEDFAFMPDGRLLVTDAAYGWVQVFDAATGRFLTRFGGKGDEEQNLDKPEGIAVDDQGNVFVADYNTSLIQKYDTSYRSFRWERTFGEYGDGPGQLIKPEFMTIHRERLYVPEADTHRVSVFDLSGRFLFAFGGPGEAPGRMRSPEAIKTGPDGLLYLTDLGNDRVQVFDPDGTFRRCWGGPGSGPGQLRAPTGIAVDAHGRVFVAELGNHRVQVFDGAGRHLGMWGRPGAGPGEFAKLHGVVIHPRTGLVYVADTGNHRVQVFRPAPAAGPA